MQEKRVMTWDSDSSAVTQYRPLSPPAAIKIQKVGEKCGIYSTNSSYAQ